MQQILSITRQFIFWLILFAVQRAIFIAFFFKLLFAEDISLTEIFQTFFHALKLDVSTSSYILIFPVLLLFFQLFIKGKWANLINQIYNALLILIFVIITSAELGIYSEWKTKLSYKALQYLRHPDEVINSIATSRFVFLSILAFIQFVVFFLVYKYFIFKAIDPQKKEPVGWKIVFSIFSPFILFLGIRGGFQAIPITVSQSYFSEHNILNLASVNSGYNLVFSVLDGKDFESKNIFKTLPDDEASDIVRQLHAVEKDTTVSILKTQRPNIVVILLESWSGDLIESLGGDPGITPEFRKLEGEGLLFTRFYATGNRSQQAMASLYGGLPGLPVTTLTDHPEKYQAVPSLVKILNKDGYNTSFYFGGQLIYGNIKSYLIYNEFDKLVEGADFDQKLPRGKLGVHDQYLFDRFLNDIDTMPQPFFANAFTLSSHSPYDQPGDKPIYWAKLENEFVNSAFYTDRCLGDFMHAAKQKSWYDNTLFIFMSDHSHVSYKNYPLESFNYHRIPLLITGGALSDDFRGKQIDIIASNVDLTKTLLKQLNLESDAFTWSKNIFNPYSQRFAFFEHNQGFGWKRPYGELVSIFIFDQPIVNSAPDDKKELLDKEGRAYIQVLLDDFSSY